MISRLRRLFLVPCSLLTLLRGYIRHHSSGISQPPHRGYHSLFTIHYSKFTIPTEASFVGRLYPQ